VILWHGLPGREHGQDARAIIKPSNGVMILRPGQPFGCPGFAAAIPSQLLPIHSETGVTKTFYWQIV